MSKASLEDLEKRIEAIEKRNSRVETDKAWQDSLFRRGLLLIFTYLALGFYMQAINIEDPWLSAVIPSVGFLLSTLTLPFLKNLWIKYIFKKR
ncbi:hypothetical protein HYW44_04230 [Candidatus Daviesbacteria bacterium]|nr:hypothetical protein [Candidatus Daviesbacteria bacterium]